MRKLFRSILAAFAIITLLPASLALAEAESKVIRVGATVDAYPLWFSSDNKFQGFIVDFLNAVADKSGYKIEWVIADWTGVVASLGTGRVDTIGSFAVLPERQKVYDYGAPYIYESATIAVSDKSKENIQTLQDLYGKKVAVEFGTSYVKVVQALDPEGKIKLSTYEGHDVLLSEAVSGRVDALVAGRNLLLAKIKARGLGLKVVGNPLNETISALPFARTERGAKLLADTNKAIAQLRAEGKLAEISTKWFGSDVTVSQLKP
ncbi:amino acid ABC transporter substrate-binding protein [Agrobacterium tumefaciens]|uniref:ABC transporter substrate binding protein (Amino acid) n=1 Tax=Agrobacterium tumefaciens str. Kerr 14 TaxID=1183424 RepID=A0A1S7SHF4_AGRTU|nr:amino acid ABC transporter substrate-binding protein [Agrobacterium tumefaciens]AYM84878.1 amino acid ABC transporter substrate-binding protein [Agrobacterium tumefaciens]NTE95110.1 amino acid ABC transporter substrate-binding protein [Agrobacterium tumefaciens]CUX68697.1 ABC transporter substrate binding protein (Amino acid) [Agrobacterium tumefaciens str. Kerr 14]